MVLLSRHVSPLAIASIGGAIIAALIGTALHPPSGSSDSTFSSPNGSVVVVNEPVAVDCPDVVSRLRIVPAEVHPKVTAEVTDLRRGIADANLRIARNPGRVVDQLNVIVAERKSAIERIIREVADAGGDEPVGLRDLAGCSIRRVPGAAPEATSTIGIDEDARQDEPQDRADGDNKITTPTGSPDDDTDGGQPGAGQPDADQTDEPDENGGGEQAGEEPEGDGIQTVSCPAVASRLTGVPNAASAEVDRNLVELRQQIAEANARLADLAANPVDDPNFIQNTILGPLRGRRIATLDRITIAIGRLTTPPSNLAALAPCTLKG